MYEIFLSSFEPDFVGPCKDNTARDPTDKSDHEVFLSCFSGTSFNGGLYRIINENDLDLWNNRVLFAFPQFEKRILCFAYDWLGSVFATDSGRLVNGNHGVLMFEPGTGKALNIPSDIQSFHDEGLIEFGEAALGISFFKGWLASGGMPPRFDQCIGYKKPLFLGGEDDIENLEVSDLDVYWHLMGQLIRKTRGLTEGTNI